MKELKIMQCERCGNIVVFLQDSGMPLICCGQKMKELVPNTVEASFDKHVPVVKHQGTHFEVCIGSEEHPMTTEHHIEWIVLQFENGFRQKCLHVGDKPKASFDLQEGDVPVAVFAYCNLHGLWKTVI